MSLLSVVIPAYNESEGIELFHNNLLVPALKNGKLKFEIIYVNDGSSDDTLQKLAGIAKTTPNVRVVALSRNFGKEIATTAGVAQAKGEAIIILDADGQHPPELIPEFVKKWQAGAQVVVGVRSSNQKEGFIKKFGSKIFYRAFNGASNQAMVPRSTDFRLISKEVQKPFLTFTERNRITRGLIDWLGFKRDYVEFDSPQRLAGEATYKTSQLVRLALNSFVSLSLKPLFLFGWVGFGIMALSSIFGLFILIEQFLLQDPLRLHFSGPAILGVFITFLVGLVLVSQAMLAIYISHIHTQTQARPLFVIDESESINL